MCFIKQVGNYRKHVLKLFATDGFSIAELSVVLAILAIVMAVGILVYVSVTSIGEERSCQANLRTIDSAICMARMDNSPGVQALFHNDLYIGTVGDLVAHGFIKGEEPICPSTRTQYSIVNGWVHCTRTPDPHWY